MYQVLVLATLDPKNPGALAPELSVWILPATREAILDFDPTMVEYRSEIMTPVKADMQVIFDYVSDKTEGPVVAWSILNGAYFAPTKQYTEMAYALNFVHNLRLWVKGRH
jgi:hypothetical protein